MLKFLDKIRLPFRKKKASETADVPAGEGEENEKGAVLGTADETGNSQGMDFSEETGGPIEETERNEAGDDAEGNAFETEEQAPEAGADIASPDTQIEDTKAAEREPRLEGGEEKIWKIDSSEETSALVEETEKAGEDAGGSFAAEAQAPEIGSETVGSDSEIEGAEGVGPEETEKTNAVENTVGGEEKVREIDSSEETSAPIEETEKAGEDAGESFAAEAQAPEIGSETAGSDSEIEGAEAGGFEIDPKESEHMDAAADAAHAENIFKTAFEAAESAFPAVAAAEYETTPDIDPQETGFIQFRNVRKIYQMGEVEIEALAGVDFVIKKGEFVVITGASGAGKSTILNILGGMDSLTSGAVIVDGENIGRYSKNELITYRRYDVGFVFQFYNLVQNLTALENVELAAQVSKKPLNIHQVIADVGLENRKNNFPSQLSGGEQQRIAIARALAKNPKLLLCDEPTGALDYVTSKSILKLLQETCKNTGTTVIVISHNLALTAIGDRVIKVKSGRVDSMVVNQSAADVDRIEW